MLTILAEGAAMADMAPVVSSIGSIGFAVWFGGYTAMYLLPGMQKSFTDALDRMTERHTATVKELVDEMKEQREAFDRWKTTHQ